MVGHELSHGFTQFTSNLFYWYQSGAINESMSDVFGEFMDLTNGAGTDTASVRWLIGEDIPGFGAIRDMQDPTAFNDPDRMTSSRYVADVDQSDSGGVHTNSGVNNKAAYLIADGDTFNGETVTGIGIDKAAQVYYEAESTLLTSGSDYADLYEALQQACANSIGGREGITAGDCLEVTDAVDATEMNRQPLAGSAPEAPVCGVDQAPVDLFFDNLENTGSGNWTHGAVSGTEDEWYYPQNPIPIPDSTPPTPPAAEPICGATTSGTTADYSIAQTDDTAVPTGSVYLRFDHSYAFEDDDKRGTRYDGGRLEYSVNGGRTWLDAGPLFTDNGYNGTIYSRAGNPLGGASAFTAESYGYISSRVDLSGLAGQRVRFRFRIGTDVSVDDYGWFIDDVRIYKCEEPLDETPPDAPTITDTDPDSPANDNSPEVKGTAEAGSTVRIYSTADCSGTALATGSASQFASPGITVSVSDNTTTSFRATATDAASNTLALLGGRFAYTEDSRAPQTSIDSAPSSPTNDSTPRFEFSADEGALLRVPRRRRTPSPPAPRPTPPPRSPTEPTASRSAPPTPPATSTPLQREAPSRSTRERRRRRSPFLPILPPTPRPPTQPAAPTPPPTSVAARRTRSASTESNSRSSAAPMTPTGTGRVGNPHRHGLRPKAVRRGPTTSIRLRTPMC